MRGDEFYDTHSCSALANVQIRFEHPGLEHYESDGAMKDLLNVMIPLNVSSCQY